MRSKTPYPSVRISEADLPAVVAAFKEGDRAAFRQLYDHFERPIYRFCRHLTGDEAMAGDAFQETFIRMYQHHRDMRTSNVQSWLFAIARRVCLNLLRARRRQNESFDEDLHGGIDAAEGDVFLREHLENALQRLPITLREALILRDVEGHSYQEIAQICGIDLSLAKVRVFRARQHMRRILTPVVVERGR